MSEPVGERALLRWAESLAGVARTGLGFTESQYERERFEEVMHIAADIKEAALHGLHEDSEASGHVEEWMKQIEKGIPGYATPKVAVGAAVTNERGELLLIQRSDSGIWLYPTGWCDIGYSAPEVVVKEVKEETGIDCEPVRLLGVLDGLRLGMSRTSFYSLLFFCRATGGEINPHPLECQDAGWFRRDNLPAPLISAETWADPIFAAIDGEVRDIFYHAVRRPVWRGGE